LLSSIVSETAKHAEDLSHSIATSSTSVGAKVLNRAANDDVRLGVLAHPDLQSVPQIKSNSQKEIAASSLMAHAQTLTEYSSYLGDLKSAVTAAPSADALQLARGAYVPMTIQMVVHPFPFPEGSISTSSTRNAGPIPIPAPYISFGEGLIPFIVGGATTVDNPAVGALLARDQAGHLATLCTATLISPNSVLTAAHCIAGAPEKVFFQHGGVYQLGTGKPAPGFSFPYKDIAVFPLIEPVLGIEPAKLNSEGRLAVGSQVYGVGFGYFSNETVKLVSAAPTDVIHSTGIKVHGIIKTQQCPPALSGHELICWTYNPSSADSDLASTCEGDSGGPLFRYDTKKSEYTIVGVATAGDTCKPGDKPVDTEVFSYVQWIQSQVEDAAPALANSLHSLPLQPVVNPVSRYPRAIQFSYLQADGTWSEEFAVDAGLATLHVSVNSIPTDKALQLEISQTGQAPSKSQSTYDTVIGFDYVNPPPGSWHVKVIGQPNQPFQWVATEFPTVH